MLKWVLKRIKVIYQRKQLQRKRWIIKRLFHKDVFFKKRYKVDGFKKDIKLICTGGKDN